MQHYRAVDEHLYALLRQSVLEEVYEGLAEVALRWGTGGYYDFLDAGVGLVGDEVGEADIEEVGALAFGRVGPYRLSEEEVSSEGGCRQG